MPDKRKFHLFLLSFVALSLPYPPCPRLQLLALQYAVGQDKVRKLEVYLGVCGWFNVVLVLRA